MPARSGTAPVRDIDFCAVGKAGRRTGITLPQRRLDEHGLEEMSHLFSSPKKPSPLKNYLLAEPDTHTDRPSTPTKRTPRPSIPRSASPRKSGINGTAKRASGLDIRSLKQNVDADPDQHQPEGQENTPRTPPRRPTGSAKATRSAKPPLRDITPKQAPTNGFHASEKNSLRVRDIVQSVEDVQPQDYDLPPQNVTPPNQTLFIPEDEVVEEEEEEDDDGPAPGGEDTDDAREESYSEIASAIKDAVSGTDEGGREDTVESEEHVELPAPIDPARPRPGRKRKSGLEMPDSSSPPKRSRTVASASPSATEALSQPTNTQVSEPAEPVQSQVKTRPPLTNKDINAKMPSNQHKELKELDQVIERIRSRPNPPKSLYLLRRETPSDDTVTRTRSGRVSFKPLAYWRNERCVWGSSPSGNGIQDGARFPLNSIKEIIRTETEEDTGLSQKKKGSKGKKKNKSNHQSRPTTDLDQDDHSSDESSDPEDDPHAEEWELERGTVHGKVAVWDSDLQQPSREEEEIEIAIAGAAIEKTGIKHHSQAEDAEPEFKYAKLLGNKFMGAGLVDLPPGGIKRPKNSKKMHMTFYVVKGRVTVTVGPSRGEPNRFSIGKGGFWQVPRGNQYSIENELDKTASIFFSQGCEVEAGMDEE